MNRRNLFKVIGAMFAGAVCAPLAALCDPETVITGPIEPTEAECHRASVSWAIKHEPQKWPNTPLRFRRYEGIAPYSNGITPMWRFDAVGEDYISPFARFKCANCSFVTGLDRDSFREHGKTCNS